MRFQRPYTHSVFLAKTESSAFGNSTLKEPLDGWGDPRLSDIFSRRRPRVTKIQPISTLQPTRASTISSTGAASNSIIEVVPTASAASTSERRKTPVRALAGGIITGVVVCVIGCSAYLHYKRKRTKLTSHQHAPIESQPDPTPWSKAELEDHQLHEVPDSQKPLPELPEGARLTAELPSLYMGTELRDTSRSAWTRFANPTSPVGGQP